MDGPPLPSTPFVITKDQQLQWLRAEITYLEDILSSHGNHQVRGLSVSPAESNCITPLPHPPYDKISHPNILLSNLLFAFHLQVNYRSKKSYACEFSIFFFFSFWGNVMMILPKYQKNLNRSESDTFTIDLVLQKTPKWELPGIQPKPHLKNLLVIFLL